MALNKYINTSELAADYLLPNNVGDGIRSHEYIAPKICLQIEILHHLRIAAVVPFFGTLLKTANQVVIVSFEC